MAKKKHPLIGFALGGGAARGWAHFGVVRALVENGIQPDIISGTSIGAVIGGAFAAGKFDEMEAWVRNLDWLRIAGFFDIKPRGGGLVQGNKLSKFFASHFRDAAIEDLAMPFSAVATDLATGREVWIREGSIIDALRASVAVPGLLAPHKIGEQWLIDGSVVDPVPVAACRALGAEIIIAVNLNSNIIGKQARRRQRKAENRRPRPALLESLRRKPKGKPGLFDVVTDAVYIMQEQITRSRLATDRPDFLLEPQLAHISIFEFDRVEEAIDEGRACAEAALPALRELLGEGYYSPPR